jgi:hypothetical protein
LIGRLIAFELSNFDNFNPSKVEYEFSAKLKIEDDKDRKKKKITYEDSDYETDDDDDEKLEALLTRRFHRGKGKYKGKLPIICFNCNEVGHIAAQCPEKKNKRDKFEYKGRRDEEDKGHYDKGKKSCYIAKEDTDNESDKSNDEEVVYVVVKDESDEE